MSRRDRQIRGNQWDRDQAGHFWSGQRRVGHKAKASEAFAVVPTRSKRHASMRNPFAMSHGMNGRWEMAQGQRLDMGMDRRGLMGVRSAWGSRGMAVDREMMGGLRMTSGKMLYS